MRSRRPGRPDRWGRWGRIGRAAALGFVVLGAALSGPGRAVGQRSLVIERFQADLEVRPSGDLLVTETLRPRFRGEWNGVVRQLRLGHTTAAGEAGRLSVEVLGAEGAGTALRWEERDAGSGVREIRIWVPDARDRVADVTLRYRVRGAIRFFAPDPEAGPAEPFDELYWEVTGTEWEVPIEDAGVGIALPPGAEPLQAVAYRGVEGSGEQVPLSLGGAGDAAVTVPSSGRLDPGEGLTVAVGWRAGLVAVPPGLDRSPPVRFGAGGSAPAPEPPRLADASPVAWLPLLLPFLVFWLAYRAWDRSGRDPRRRAIAVAWEPPEGLSAAEVGTLVDHTPHMHDILATLVDLAVRGYVVIAERPKRGFLKFGKDYAFHLVRPRSEWDDLADHERLFLDGLFRGASRTEVLANLAEEGSFLDEILESVAGEPASESAPPGTHESVLLSDLQNQFYKEIPEIQEAILDALVRKGHYARRPDQVRNRWIGLTMAGFFLALLSIPGFAAGTATGLAFGVAMIAVGGASGIILGVFAALMPARTERGARTREAALGFARFLEKVESPRYRRMITSPDQFEAYLPFAMAFRCEEKWARAFDDLLTQPPTWYHGGHTHFRPSVFASDLGTLSSTASSALSSSPSSSGSGGGGSVGGGSGGGGGGGF